MTDAPAGTPHPSCGKVDDGLRAVREWEREHGVFSDNELEQARDSLDLVRHQ